MLSHNWNNEQVFLVPFGFFLAENNFIKTDGEKIEIWI